MCAETETVAEVSGEIKPEPAAAPPMQYQQILKAAQEQDLEGIKNIAKNRVRERVRKKK